MSRCTRMDDEEPLVKCKHGDCPGCFKCREGFVADRCAAERAVTRAMLAGLAECQRLREEFHHAVDRGVVWVEREKVATSRLADALARVRELEAIADPNALTASYMTGYAAGKAATKENP